MSYNASAAVTFTLIGIKTLLLPTEAIVNIAAEDSEVAKDCNTALPSTNDFGESTITKGRADLVYLIGDVTF